MKEIRFHGSGGHGAVMAAKLLADAAARSGYKSQAFASYGALRRGGKVEAYVRISNETISVHCKMYEPNYLVVMDDQFVDDADVMGGLKEGGKILINSSRTASEFDGLDRFETITFDAYRIARVKGLSLPGGMPVINTAMLGGIAALLPEIQLENLLEVIRTSTPRGDDNAESARTAYNTVVQSLANPSEAMREKHVDSSPEEIKDKFPHHDTGMISDKCGRCLICYMACPVVAINFKTEPILFHVNTKACTSCGLCINECPRKIISWQGGAE